MTETAARDANPQCAGFSALLLPIHRRDPERHLEQPGCVWGSVPKLVIFVSPFSIDLVPPGIQGVDPPFQPLPRDRQTLDLLLDPLAREAADEVFPPSLRGIQLAA